MPGSKVGFAVIGAEHVHIHYQVGLVQSGGGRLLSLYDPDPRRAAALARRYPEARLAASMAEIFGDERIRLVVCASQPTERARVAMEAMRSGKDVFVDKPGVVTRDQLDAVRRVQAETGRHYMVAFFERFALRSAVKALELVRDGAIGAVHSVVGFGPHHLGADRPPWFFSRALSGGILNDIGVHQTEQFLAYTGAARAFVTMARADNFHHADRPSFHDHGEVAFSSERATGYSRVDWLSPSGLDAWGDARVFVYGSEGYLEARKTIDPASGRRDRLIKVDQTATHDVCLDGVEISAGVQICRDVLERTNSLMEQEHCFRALDLALTAQEVADRSDRAVSA